MIIENLQILRAFAALAVLFFHMQWAGIALGSFGVDIFFVISGFIMTHICHRRQDLFFLRRVIRIIPIYWSLSLLVFVLALLLPSLFPEVRSDMLFLFESLLFIPTYDAQGAIQPIISIGWTLNYEMFFYALTGISLLLCPPRYATFAAALILGALVLWLPASGCSTAACQFYSDPLMLEFGLGVLCFHLYKRLRKTKRIPTVIWWIVLLAALAVCYWVEANGLFGMNRLAAFGAPAFAVVTAALMLEARIPMSAHHTLVPVGNASYTLYLIHLYIVLVFNHWLATLSPWLSTTHTVGAILCVLVVLTLSLTLTKRFELPIIRRLKRSLLPSRN